MDEFKDKTILLTGGTGSFGKAFVTEVLAHHEPKAIRVFSRDELKQWEMARQFGHNDKLRFLIGDVRDGARLRRAAEGVDVIIHAAALKHITSCEYNPQEAVQTNINGAINVINAALDANVDRVIALSTDKAVSPVNLYGATKLCSDRLFIQSNSYRGERRATRFSVVRYGNVLGSRGSVVPLFKEQRDAGKELTLTDERMTRFSVTLPDAVRFVISSLGMMKGGELFVPKLPSVRVTDLADALAPGLPRRVIGIRPGEKLHEALFTREESRNALQMADRYVILSGTRGEWGAENDTYRDTLPVKEEFEYNSFDNESYLTVAEIRSILETEKLV